ncbi:nicotinate-nucleotide diphosphorylase (carboxylating) [Fervidobacterium thailandense]|uniref:nicotinate-nucleotide diphosphorylase (carboxylating) n=1 Tax=Fervidobacterium thailandense TaxID=1008305 RepID=A0A1E3G370_9BACT|nr:nicotinate-nucleotide diphosphorylase (carboxylating) [Fervidobacterium thailandense]
MVEEIVKLIRDDEYFIDFASYPLRGTVAKGNILLKSEWAVLSGTEIVEKVLERFDVKVKFFHRDGECAERGVVATLEGDAYNVLVCERTILNVLSFMSSIATKTRILVERLRQKGVHTKIAATRKTIPFTAMLQKIAVIHGGGDTHRLNLSDMVMIKDNHIALYGCVSEAVRKVKEMASFSKKIEIEVEDEDTAFEAANAGVDVLMLDNMPVEHACELAGRLKRAFPHIIIEYSGGVDPNNIEKYACEYFDVISVGRLTSEVSYVDFSLEVSRSEP